MVASPAEPGPPTAPTERISFWDRLKQIDMFFQGRDPVHKTMRRAVKRLEKAAWRLYA
jgi:hypothetical protein